MFPSVPKPPAIALAALLLASPAAAQAIRPIARIQTAAPRPAVVPRQTEDDAQETRNRLRTVLQQYPPSLAQVLRLDSTLLSNPEYLAAYPSLAAFVTDHPEVARNAPFFVGTTVDLDPNPSRDRIRAIEGALAGLLVFMGLMTLLGVLGWIAKMTIDHRRWLRISRTQGEVQNKLLDRMTSNEDLLAYLQTPAGRRLLDGASPAELGGRPVNAPVGRILFSIQAGTVLGMVGAGVLFLSSRVASNPILGDAAPFLFMIGTVIASAGAGFLVSAVLSYGMSKHLGLIQAPVS